MIALTAPSGAALGVAIALLAMIARPGHTAQVIWEQLPDGETVLGSQEDVCYPFESWIADSFEATGDEISAIRWWGAYWNGSPVAADEAVVEFRSPREDGLCPAYGAPLVSTRVLSFSESPVTFPNGRKGFEYQAVLPEPFLPEAGEVYFISIQLALCFPPQWGIATGTGDDQGCCHEGDWPPNWTWLRCTTIFGFPYEPAFALYTGEVVPTDTATWSRLKGLYQR
jgi:hypothetical protein